ncbi:MAG: general secretion pathway protein GspK [Deltaproteobacteria bacterium]|nr:general secretion pathway protein GspK [Deltaproteobacteria bacterium]
MWGRRKKDRCFTQRGVALVAVSAIIAIGAAVTADFSYHTNVDFTAAANARDDMRAHFLAVSGANLSKLVIKVQKDMLDKYRGQIGDVQLADYLPMFIGAFGGGKDEVESLAGLIGVDSSLASGIKGLGLKEGEFDVKVTTDDGKINVNCANGSAATQRQLELMLTALVLPSAYDRIFEERDGDGQFTDRATFVRAIIDYIDRDQAGYGTNGGPEDYGYESRKEPYRAKDNYIDSIDELQLVRGMDDKRWALFSQAFTIYGGCKVNIGAVSDLNVIAAVLYQAAKDPNDPVLNDPVKLLALTSRVSQARALGILFDDLDGFAKFVQNPDAELGELAKATGANYTPVQGVELDQAKLRQVARYGGRRTYRVETTSRMGRVEKKITAVWDTETVNQNARDPAYVRGAWVYWREE